MGPEILRPTYTPEQLEELKTFGQTLDYQKDIQPILNRRCVVCHSCYNSPCQLKMGSFDGLARGATKQRVYNATRFFPTDPTRLHTDSTTTEEWRKKQFADVAGVDGNVLGEDSFMFQLLDLKECYPEVKGLYEPESKDLTCSQTDKELKGFMKKNPHAGMPFGFPEISKENKRTLRAWLAAGAKGPDQATDEILKSPSNGTAGKAVLQRWESFLNEPSPKMVTTARYLYEHLFLAHIYFDEIPGDFFSLVRSKTPWPEPIDEIPTLKPYDDPGGIFYYRFRKIHDTIVYKTHILYRFNDARMARFQKLFLEPKWPGGDIIIPGYEPDDSANPFFTFRQIPPRSRYQFLLDDSHYFVMTFIRGPVCKGQIALNVIHDHFWILFLDPDSDLSVTDKRYLEDNYKFLRMPIETRGRFDRLFYTPFLIARNLYLGNRTEAYHFAHPEGLGLDDIWAGDHAGSNPFLTVYRHFDSATVTPGPLGGFPDTGWVLDYPQLERIYYNLVAGFNVFGNIKEQVGIRKYMNLQRKEAEMLLLSFLPPETRLDLWLAWYPTILSRIFVIDDSIRLDDQTPTQVEFPESLPGPLDYKNDFFRQVLDKRIRKDIGYNYDPMNFHPGDHDRSPAQAIVTEADLVNEMRKITHVSGGFVEGLPDKGDLAFVRFARANKEDLIYTFILNRYHDNVEFMEGEDLRLDKTKNTIHIVKGFLGGYPNAFFKVDFNEATEFFKMLLSSNQQADSFYLFFERFGVKRSAPDFWEMSDYFNDRFKKDHPLEAGYFDLNRYANESKPPTFFDHLVFNLMNGNLEVPERDL